MEQSIIKQIKNEFNKAVTLVENEADTEEYAKTVFNSFMEQCVKLGLNENITCKVEHSVNRGLPVIVLNMYYKTEKINIQTIDELCILNDDNYKYFTENYVENNIEITREKFVENMSFIDKMNENIHTDIGHRIYNLTYDIFNKYKGNGILDENLYISIDRATGNMKFIYDGDSGKHELVVNDLEKDILNFDPLDFDYTENGIILNSKDIYDDLLLIEGNKLTVTGLVDTECDGIVFTNGNRSRELSDIISYFIETSKVETKENNYRDFDETDDWESDMAIIIPNVSISIFHTTNKITKKDILNYKVLSSIGELDLITEQQGYSEFTIEGYDIVNFKLLGNGGEHDLYKILELMEGNYVQFQLEVINNEK